jgi:hypothetical protein
MNRDVWALRIATAVDLQRSALSVEADLISSRPRYEHCLQLAI